MTEVTKNLEAEDDDLLSEVFEDWDRVRFPLGSPPPLWHYTNAAGFFGILSSRGYLKATDSRFLNDASELKYGLDAIATAINSNELLSAVQREELCREIGKLEREPVYVASMSANCNLLSQWRLYADDAQGYCIKLQFRDFRAIVEQDPTIGRIAVQCTYGHEELARKVSDRCRSILGAADKGLKPGRLGRALGRLARHEAAATKDPIFREEEEWRIVIDHADAHVEYEPRRTRLTPFVYTDHAEICEVLVGPRAGGDAAVEATRGYLRKLDISAEVREWKGPYRGR